MSGSALFIAGVRCLPRRTVSRAARRVVELRSEMAARRFAAAFGIDLADAELDRYPSVHALFTRRLKPGARPVDRDPPSLVSPVDGTLSVHGRVGDGPLPQAKGRTYTVEALLAGGDQAARFAAGSFATFYLSPRDYHRIHAPADGAIVGWTHVPGDLFPVNRSAVTHVDQLFARNERLITDLETERFGAVTVVKVGATIVGRVRASYAPEVTTNAPGVRELRSHRFAERIPVQKGEEIGVFEMGSTVILLSERTARFTAEPGAPVRMGQRVGVAG